ncbi:MAG TPA: PilX N-terminal domain-containing pilus assembly protein [Nitrospiria bacterium]|jgi:Tfp pilus assembly protein PilX|nr:PilX N-terminal domain-containing pilus assembly protein [Nitrospiria bacterium]
MKRLKSYLNRGRTEWTDERGVALVMTMLILLMLTFIGMATISTSSTELSLSANYRRSREAFHAASAAIEYALLDNRNFVVPATGPGTLTVAGGFPGDVDLMEGDTTATGSVTFLGSGPPPAGSKMGMDWEANYFAIDTTGKGSLGSTDQQELAMDKIVPAPTGG